MTTWNTTQTLSLPRMWNAPLDDRGVLRHFELHTEWLDSATGSRLLLIHDSTQRSPRSAGRYRVFRMTRSGRVDEITAAVLGSDGECTISKMGTLASKLGVKGYHLIARSDGFIRCVDRINYRIQQKSAYPLLRPLAA